MYVHVYTRGAHVLWELVLFYNVGPVDLPQVTSLVAGSFTH